MQQIDEEKEKERYYLNYFLVPRIYHREENRILCRNASHKSQKLKDNFAILDLRPYLQGVSRESGTYRQSFH